MSASINRKMNLVIPVDQDSGQKIYVHSAPISREIFETNYEVLARAFTEIMAGGFGAQAGPGVAALVLKKIAKQLGLEKQVADGLIPEIHRLTNVLVPGIGLMNLDEAIERKVFDEDDLAEVLNELAFFTVISSAAPRKDRPSLLAFMAHVWNAETTLLNPTEYEKYLKTSTEDASTGEKVKA
jgi:hypothetical protein